LDSIEEIILSDICNIVHSREDNCSKHPQRLKIETNLDQNKNSLPQSDLCRTFEKQVREGIDISSL